MNIYCLQDIYRNINNPYLRLATVNCYKKISKRYLMVRMDTNDACNLYCVMCPFSNRNREPLDKPMSVENFEKIVGRLFDKTRYLYLSCVGEPLMTPHFDRLLDVLSRYQIPFVSYATNGLLLKDSFIDASLRNKINEIILSVDGSNQKTYESIRIGGKWDKLNERLSALKKARIDSGSLIPAIRFNYTVMAETCHEIEDFVHWSFQWNPGTIQFRLFYPRVGSIKQNDFEYTKNEYKKRLPGVKKLCKSKKIRLLADIVPKNEIRMREKGVQKLAEKIRGMKIKSKTEDNADFSKDKQNVLISKPRFINCQLPWVTAYVNLIGDIYPCPVYPEPIGNIIVNSFEEIEKSVKMKEIRSSLFRNPKDICIECQQQSASGV